MFTLYVQLQILVKAVPVKDEHSLILSWPIKPELRCYKEAPSQYIGHLLGHEAEGSLFALLKKVGKEYPTKTVVETSPLNFQDLLIFENYSAVCFKYSFPAVLCVICI